MTHQPVRLPGPWEFCHDCGAGMMWSDPDASAPSWMCPRCVYYRMVRAESDCKRVGATERVAAAPEQYPCADCGKLRTKAEGGTVFTVCEECWDKHRPGSVGQSADARVMTDHEGLPSEPSLAAFRQALSKALFAHGDWARYRKPHEEARNDELALAADNAEAEVIALFERAAFPRTAVPLDSPRRLNQDAASDQRGDAGISEPAGATTGTAVPQEPDCDSLWRERMDYLFAALPFEIRHRWGGDAREMVEGIDWAIADAKLRSGVRGEDNTGGTPT